jgi:cytochrome P450 family 110
MALPLTALRDAEALPPGPDATPDEITLWWLARPYALLDECAATFGDTFTLRFARFGTHVVVSHPDDVRSVFAAERDVLSAGRGNALLEPVLGRRSLLLLDGAAHAHERARLLSAFRPERLARVGALAADAVARHTAAWRDGAVVSLQRTALDVSQDVILCLLLGADAEARATLGRLLHDLMAVVAANAIPHDPDDPSPLARRFRAARHAVHVALQELVAHRRRHPTAGAGDVLGLLTAAPDLADAEIRDELLTLVLAGHETTAGALCWAVTLLHDAPAARARLDAELDAHRDLPDAWLAGLPYLQAVCLETLRLRPVVPVVSRAVLQPLTLRHRVLPAGVFVTPAVHLAHRRTPPFTEPAAFRPERFLAQRFGRHEYFPFGGGARRCLGMGLALVELQVVLGALARRFQLVPAGRRDIRPIRRAVTVVPSGACRVRVRARPVV